MTTETRRAVTLMLKNKRLGFVNLAEPRSVGKDKNGNPRHITSKTLSSRRALPKSTKRNKGGSIVEGSLRFYLNCLLTTILCSMVVFI